VWLIVDTICDVNEFGLGMQFTSDYILNGAIHGFHC